MKSLIATFILATVVAMEPVAAVRLSDADVDSPVKRSCQYVSIYNVNNKLALKQAGRNTGDADTELEDHTMCEIARPNNDTLYRGRTGCRLIGRMKTRVSICGSACPMWKR